MATAAPSLPQRQPNNNYVCQVFTDQADHRMLERLFRDYKPNDVSSLPSFILGMDRLVSEFRSQYHPEAITDGDAQNLEDQAQDDQAQDSEEEDEVLPEGQGPEQGQPPEGGEEQVQYVDDQGNPVDDQGNPLEQAPPEGGEEMPPEEEQQQAPPQARSSVIEAAMARFGPNVKLHPAFEVSAAHNSGMSEESEGALRQLLNGFHVSSTFINGDTYNNTVTIGTTIKSITTGRIQQIESKLRELYPHMQMLEVMLVKSRLALRMKL